MANFWWRVGLKNLNPLIKVFEMMNNDDYGHVGISIAMLVPWSGQRRRPNQQLAHLRTFEAVCLIGIRIGVQPDAPFGVICVILTAHEIKYE
jgi:hypothetical protein